ncbi:MAG TPA: type II toxin-antitoxin system Phd/YefM family antitoxin [Gemmatimonadetes bacterium]|nr:type II toxin-antitoxin system Phd/YefM family antitoxin [Gemmatimonadota bacterium]
MGRDIEVIAISKFKATCLATLERVRRTGRPILVTRRGEPIAEVIPPRPPVRESGWLGSMAARATVTGNIVAPVAPVDEWEVVGT